VRALSGQADYEQAVALQEQIWGADVRDTVPACVLQISQEVGGIAVGAFTPDNDLAGFVFGLTGFRNGFPAHWSHILAVAIPWRDRGVGRILKEHQRELLLEMGVETMHWTFDPLESRNAHLNLNVLGATVERYVPHFYGETAVAATDTVIGTDRLVVRWYLRGKRTPPAHPDLSLAVIPSTTRGAALGTSDSLPDARSSSTVRIDAPADIQTLKSADPESAANWRRLTRRAFIHYLDAGYTVTEFRVERGGRGGSYILVRQR